LGQSSCGITISICPVLVQAAAGNSVRYLRRGWDFTLQNVIKWAHEDEEYREAADAAHPLDFNDVDGLVGNMYMHLLDKDCNYVLSKRQSSSDAGIYGLGVSLLSFARVVLGCHCLSLACSVCDWRCLSMLGRVCLCLGVCVSMLGCPCLCLAVFVYAWLSVSARLCASMLGCVCLCLAVCVSMLGCQCLCLAVSVYAWLSVSARLCASMLGRVCLCLAVSVC